MLSSKDFSFKEFKKNKEVNNSKNISSRTKIVKNKKFKD